MGFVQGVLSPVFLESASTETMMKSASSNSVEAFLSDYRLEINRFLAMSGHVLG
jgi:hypothetical protein